MIGSKIEQRRYTLHETTYLQFLAGLLSLGLLLQAASPLSALAGGVWWGGIWGVVGVGFGGGWVCLKAALMAM